MLPHASATHGESVLLCGGGRALGVRDLATAELRQLLHDPESLLWQNLQRPVKIDHGCLMVEARITLTGGEARVAYKRYRARGGWKSVCSLFRRSRARRSWRLSRALVDAGIATARPLVMCEPRQGWLPRTSYLAAEWIEGAENLHLYGWRLAKTPLDTRLRRAGACARPLGQMIGRMHAARIAYRDLKAANLLVVQAADGRTSVYLVDPDGVQIRRRLSPGRRAANLARLAAGLEAHPWVTASICCRFLRAYAEQFPPGTICWKSLWREIADRARRIIRRKHRRGEEVL